MGEVLFALDIPQDDQGGAEDTENAVTSQETCELEASAPVTGSEEASRSPRFRRIVLGSQHDVPLRMARDLLEAAREDASIFEKLQKRYSEFPSESIQTLS